MRKPGQIILFAFTSLLLLGLLLGRGRATTAVIRAADAGIAAHLPVVFSPDVTPVPVPTLTPTPEPTVTPGPTPEVTPTVQPAGLRNPSFEEGWHDIEFGNQRPKKWEISWVNPGDPLYDSADLATGVCECVHKLASQLPPDEQPGGTNALILSGTAVYKLFSGQAWGTTLSQSLDLPPGSEWRLSVPVRLHNYGDTDPFGAESSLWVNNEGGWANIAEMGDRRWCTHTRDFTVPAGGDVQIDIRFKSKYPLVKDFFIDDLLLAPAGQGDLHPGIPDCKTNMVLDTYKPYQK